MRVANHDLFGGPPPAARQSDPWTSHEAAERAQRTARAHKAIIYRLLLQNGPSTIDELAKYAPFDSVEVARRLPEMERAGSAVTTGKVRPGLSGRRMREWRAVA
jgi:predicted transcriptional regulator